MCVQFSGEKRSGNENHKLIIVNFIWPNIESSTDLIKLEIVHLAFLHYDES